MNNILVPVDLSESSHKILQQAVKLAKMSDAKLHLLNVVSMDIGFIVGDVGYQYLPELEQTVLEEDARQLKDLEQQVTDQGVECDSIVKQGIPVDIILEESDNLNVSYIVIGSQGHGTLYEALVGSVCHDVIKNSKVPLLVVPSKQENK